MTHDENDDLKLTVNVRSLVKNYRYFVKDAPCTEIGAVLKADGYGLGAPEIAPYLEEAGCKTFFVATLDEGIALRQVISGKIYIFHGIRPNQYSLFIEHNLTPILNNIDEIKQWNNLSKWEEISLPAGIRIDTGMNRLGCSMSDDIQSHAENIKIELIMSHLACAKDKDHPMNRIQLDRFLEIKKQYAHLECKFSLASSAGFFLGPEYHFDISRIGTSLYGVYQGKDKSRNPLNEVIELCSRVIHIHDVDPGEGVGYGATYTTQAKERLATIAIGYADGYPKSLENKGFVAINGNKCPIRGKIAMGLTIVGIDNAPSAKVGDWATLIGPGCTLDELSDSSGIYNLDLITKIGKRVRRIYIDDEE